jgi:hypothetical protein
MPPVEFAALVDRLVARDRKMQIETAKILAMLANCHLSRDEKPDGWSPADFLPGAKKPQMSMREWILARQRGELHKLLTDEERAEINDFNRRFSSVFKYTPGEVIRERV